jgi:DNA-binding transcriptional MerR regulator
MLGSGVLTQQSTTARAGRPGQTGGIRHYAEEHARRLRFIREAQKLGFSLDEVGELLSLEDES